MVFIVQVAVLRPPAAGTALQMHYKFRYNSFHYPHDKTWQVTKALVRKGNGKFRAAFLAFNDSNGTI